MEVKVTILEILRTYEIYSIQTEDQLRFIPNLVLDNVGGIPLRIKPRYSSESDLQTAGSCTDKKLFFD